MKLNFATICATMLCGLMLAPLASHAQGVDADGTRSVQPPSASTFARDLQETGRMLIAQNACRTSLDLTVQNASLEDIITRVQKKLPPLPTTPISNLRIEVRGLHPVRLSFDTKNSTIADVLDASATLAGGKLWIFPDYLLLAPSEMLSPAEQDARVKRLVGERQPSGQLSLPSMIDTQNQEIASFIVGELKLLGSKANLDAAINPKGDIYVSKIGDHISFNQLSPTDQAIVQALSEWLSQEFSRTFPESSFPSPTLMPDDIVGFTSQNKETLVLATSDWHVTYSNHRRSFSVNNLPPTSPSGVPPFVDPSAGNS